MDRTFFDKAAAALPDACFTRPPDLAIVLGSGWGDALTCDRTLVRIPYSDIPGFGVPTVAGRAGELRLYQRGGRRVLAFCGRRHWYEDHPQYSLYRRCCYRLRSQAIGW